MQLYTDSTGAQVIKGPRIPPMNTRVVNVVQPCPVPSPVPWMDEYLKQCLPTYSVKAQVKTWYATLHIAGNIDVAKAFIQKKILNDGACFQIAPVDYVYSGGAESGMTIRCIHYPRFVDNGPEKLLSRLMLLANELAKELGQKSYTIETSDTTMYFDNGNKHG